MQLKHVMSQIRIVVFLLSSFSCCVSSSPVERDESSATDNHRVYSYSYHFQHNGTNPKDLFQKFFAEPELGLHPEERSLVRTFSDPNIRGFFVKGFLPGRPNDFGSHRNVDIDGIRKVVESNLPPPPPPPPPLPPALEREFPNNFLRTNIPGEFGRPRGNVRANGQRPPDNVVTRVQHFERDTPTGRVVGKVETFSYNSPLTVNSVSNAEGFRRNQQTITENQRITGQRTQSYFRRHFRRGPPNGVPQLTDFNVAQKIDGNNEWWRGLPRNNNNRGHVRNNVNIRNLQNNNNNNNNRGDLRNNAIVLGHINNNNAPVSWDDNSNVNWNNNDWSVRTQRNNQFVNQIRENFEPGNPRPFSNGHSGPFRNPSPPQNMPIVQNRNPVDLLKSTIEALVRGGGGGGGVEIPPPHPIGNHGNFRNVDGGGVEKVFDLERIARGPNSFSRDKESVYERNFAFNSNAGYNRANRWSGNIRRSDTDSSEDFSKDFIDVFRDE